MDQLINLNNQTAGRDKIARLLQYLSRFLWHRLQKNNSTSVNNIKNLEYQLSTFRKLLRFGRSIDSIYATLPLLHHDNSTVRYTLVLSKICNSLFLLADHVLWLGRADLVNIKIEKWSNMSNKYWLFSITMNLVRDFHEISLIINNSKCLILPKGGVQNIGDIFSAVVKSLTILSGNKSVCIDTIKNGCDIFIPLVALGHVKFSPGTIGLLGAISSIAGLMVLLEPRNKLSPA
ncbi:unnamed protein product [Brassicogethes aeneus]|uniref:Peroxisomal membrane protein 11B n=1 Tax=Brassicogethes aeneus TaxID=1431903 RepID=A0A9P0B083_BRAAE|nr:unnamed protein product [Brassicogethes aeneus]